MSYVDTSNAHADAIPQASAAATYFIFGPSGSNAFGATDQTLSATPTAVAATGGSASAGTSGAGSNQALTPGSVIQPNGISTQTLLMILAGTIGAVFLAQRFLR